MLPTYHFATRTVILALTQNPVSRIRRTGADEACSGNASRTVYL